MPACLLTTSLCSITATTTTTIYSCRRIGSVVQASICSYPSIDPSIHPSHSLNLSLSRKPHSSRSSFLLSTIFNTHQQLMIVSSTRETTTTRPEVSVLSERGARSAHSFGSCIAHAPLDRAVHHRPTCRPQRQMADQMERRMRPIFEAVDSRNYKQAVKLATQLLSKTPNAVHARVRAAPRQRRGAIESNRC